MSSAQTLLIKPVMQTHTIDLSWYKPMTTPDYTPFENFTHIDDIASEEEINEFARSHEYAEIVQGLLLIARNEPFRARRAMRHGFTLAQIMLMMHLASQHLYPMVVVQFRRKERAKVMNMLRVASLIRSKTSPELLSAVVNDMQAATVGSSDDIKRVSAYLVKNTLATNELMVGAPHQAMHPIFLKLFEHMVESLKVQGVERTQDNWEVLDAYMPHDMARQMIPIAITMGMHGKKLEEFRKLVKEEVKRRFSFRDAFSFPSYAEL